LTPRKKMCLITYFLHSCGHRGKESQVEPCEFADQTGHVCGSDGGFQTGKDIPAFGECMTCLHRRLPKKQLGKKEQTGGRAV
jgi:hypothetical protein